MRAIGVAGAGTSPLEFRALSEPIDYFAQAVEAQRAGRLDDARALYTQVLQENPRDVDALHLLGRIAIAKGELDFGIALLQQAVRLAPQFAEAQNNLGNACAAKPIWEAAVAAYRAAVAADPTYAEAWANLGSALTIGTLGGPQKTTQQLTDAADACRRALRLRPGLAEGWNNLGGALTALGEVESSVVAYREALRLKPAYAEALGNLAYSLQLENQLEAALACYREAVRVAPDFAVGHFGEGLVQLLAGNLRAGFPKYEARWDAAQRGQRRDFAAPLWLGEPPLAGKTILLHAEQGLGDTLQFARYAPLLTARGARVLLEVQSVLKPLLGSLPGVARLLVRGEALPAFDLHCPLLSLPLACGTDRETVPADTPYVRAPADRVERWRPVFAGIKEVKVGVAWAGNPHHRNDRNRSVPFESFAALFATPGCRFFGLQKDVAPDDAARLARMAAFTDFSAQIADFGDSAAIIQELDIVVTVDTATAHLAGALGAKTWILLPFSPDWRWMIEREDSPWYPTARLFRQKQPGHWPAVIDRVAVELRALADTRVPGSS